MDPVTLALAKKYADANIRAGDGAPLSQLTSLEDVVDDLLDGTTRPPNIAPVINVTDYGATGDGVTDDLAAILLAAADVPTAGGTLYFPSGTYRISANMDLRGKSNLAVRGEGRYTTFIRPDEAVAYAIFVGGTATDNRQSYITVADIGTDGVNQDPAPESGWQFGSIRVNFADHVTIRDVYCDKTHDGIILRDVHGFSIRNVHATDMTEGPITFFQGTKRGIVDTLYVDGCDEVIDFFDNEDILVTNVYGRTTVTDTDEAFDLSSSRRIHISNCVLHGFQHIIHAKNESDIAWEDYTVENVEAHGFGGWFLNGASTEGNKRITVRNCKGYSEVATSNGLGIGPLVDGVRFEGNHMDVALVAMQATGRTSQIVRGNRLKSGGRALSAVMTDAMADRTGHVYEGNECESTTLTGASEGCIHIAGANAPAIRGNTAKVLTETQAIRISNCRAPRIERNEVLAAGRVGMEVVWSNETGLDATSRVIGAVIDDNIVRNHGLVTASRTGLFVDVRPSGVTGVYNVLSLCRNRVLLDSETTSNNQFGIFVGKGTLDSIDYAKGDDNVVFGVVGGPLTLTAFGVNSTSDGNLTSTRA